MSEKDSTDRSTGRRKVLQQIGAVGTTGLLSTTTALGTGPNREKTNQSKSGSEVKSPKILEELYDKRRDSITTQEDGSQSVYFCCDKTLQPTSGGATAKDEWNVAASLDADYDVYNERMRAGVSADAGYGTLRAVSYLGNDFTVESTSGTKTANIIARGDYDGGTGNVQGGAHSIAVQLRLEDYTAGWVHRDTIFSESGTVETYNNNYGYALQWDLEAGHSYYVSVETIAEITANDSIGALHVDFSDWDSDDNWVDAHGFEINWL